ncbi:MarR family winged helix-turn-helix transcriptional regulator [Aquimarina sp. 2201CG14-23]|uniref:MarR family winged helix-turn-helix transcriptional regulator n=1 Tax=Aquimarina mycalae TaxID=3040073 RepID=UPI002477EBEC|nr:MarR family transcriptional regulator [Aquimarina sp. 2201CG14-23]MDH7444963.1 MarR family transcriptional regulator [Aquimarina sp. 2201CG14-23]
MNVNNPSSTIFYAIEEAIKAYRKLSAREIKKVISDITVDQALILQIISENQITQTEIADLIFKDYASMTRIIGLMIKKEYIIKTVNEQDKRAAVLKITNKGEISLKKLSPIINTNRQIAIDGITPNELMQLKTILNKITQNCKIN